MTTRFAWVLIMQCLVRTPTNFFLAFLFRVRADQQWAFYPTFTRFCAPFCLFRSRPYSIGGGQNVNVNNMSKDSHRATHCDKFIRESDGSAEPGKFIRPTISYNSYDTLLKLLIFSFSFFDSQGYVLFISKLVKLNFSSFKEL